MLFDKARALALHDRPFFSASNMSCKTPHLEHQCLDLMHGWVSACNGSGADQAFMALFKSTVGLTRTHQPAKAAQASSLDAACR